MKSGRSRSIASKRRNLPCSPSFLIPGGGRSASSPLIPRAGKSRSVSPLKKVRREAALCFLDCRTFEGYTHESDFLAGFVGQYSWTGVFDVALVSERRCARGLCGCAGAALQRFHGTAHRGAGRRGRCPGNRLGFRFPVAAARGPFRTGHGQEGNAGAHPAGKGGTGLSADPQGRRTSSMQARI